jgi:hypothetical protein
VYNQQYTESMVGYKILKAEYLKNKKSTMPQPISQKLIESSSEESGSGSDEEEEEDIPVRTNVVEAPVVAPVVVAVKPVVKDVAKTHASSPAGNLKVSHVKMAAPNAEQPKKKKKKSVVAAVPVAAVVKRKSTVGDGERKKN